jgi:hypothetical protein
MTAGYPSEEPIAGKPHDGICGGEGQQWLSYPTSVQNCTQSRKRRQLAMLGDRTLLILVARVRALR